MAVDEKMMKAADFAKVSSIDFVYTGSSPRMRGAPQCNRRDRAALGIIPAYAGSTRRRASAPRTGRDHPRVCGEHEGRSVSWKRTVGSSPRMRGALG